MVINPNSIKSIQDDVPLRPTLIMVEGRYQNWIKPMILLQSLNIQFDTVVLNGLPHMKTEWYRKLHPQRMVPVLIDNVDGERVVIWDSTSIMMYLCDRYDVAKRWYGKTLDETAEVWNWLIFQTASFGPTSKYWVHFDLRPADKKMPEAQQKLFEDLKTQYGIMNTRLSEPDQRWLALKDRPTIADLANYPFTDTATAARMGLDLNEFPALKEWSERMAGLESVKKVYDGMGEWKAIDVLE